MKSPLADFLRRGTAMNQASILQTAHGRRVRIQRCFSLALEFAQPAKLTAFRPDLTLSFQDAQAAMLAVLDAVIQLGPEFYDVLHHGYQGQQDHGPKQDLCRQQDPPAVGLTED